MIRDFVVESDGYLRYFDTNVTCVQSVRGCVAPAAEQDERPEVKYKPVMPITVGFRAGIVPVDHYSWSLVTNGELAWTGTVLAYDATTGAFETKRTRYVLDMGYEH